MSVQKSNLNINISSFDLSLNRLGLWLFIISDISFFVALISSRFFVYGVVTPDDINQYLGLGLTILLLTSSLTAYRSEIAAKNQNFEEAQRNILYTIIMGILFIIGVGFEWDLAFHHESTQPSSPYGTILFTLTGVHAFHVISGILIFVFVYFNNPSSKNNYWKIEASAKWWHLVDLAWVAIYPTLYLIN